MNGTLARRALFSLLISGAVLACSRSPRARSEAEVAAQSPAKDTREPQAASPAQGERTQPGELSDFQSVDGLVDDQEKKAEEPSLSQPPPAEVTGPADEDWQRLAEEEDDFAEAMDPSALSCSGALPLRDTICQLAERICVLPPSGASIDAAKRDCERARASCEKAKKSYAGRCGG
jgi:hypothetical protein